MSSKTGTNCTALHWGEGQGALPDKSGKPISDPALDVTVVNPLQAATVAHAAETAGHAQKRKMEIFWQPQPGNRALASCRLKPRCLAQVYQDGNF